MDLMTEFFKYFKFIGIFAILLIAVITVLIVVMSIGVFSNRKKSRKSPIIKEKAKVVSKRMHYSKSRNFDSLDTHCYATFEVESGDRMELSVPYNEYGLLVEGDQGVLEFQGTLFLNFVRKKRANE